MPKRPLPARLPASRMATAPSNGAAVASTGRHRRRNSVTTTTHAAATTRWDRCAAMAKAPSTHAQRRSPGRRLAPKPSTNRHSTATGAKISGISNDTNQGAALPAASAAHRIR